VRLLVRGWIVSWAELDPRSGGTYRVGGIAGDRRAGSEISRP
jgi:hypothetical protein